MGALILSSGGLEACFIRPYSHKCSCCGLSAPGRTRTDTGRLSGATGYKSAAVIVELRGRDLSDHAHIRWAGLLVSMRVKESRNSRYRVVVACLIGSLFLVGAVVSDAIYPTTQAK